MKRGVVASHHDEIILSLPEEIWREILSYLDLFDKICHFSETSKRNHILASECIEVIDAKYFLCPIFDNQNISKFYNLTELDLSGQNSFTDNALSNFSRLRKLDLTSNEIITDAAITHLTTLTSLNLKCNLTITNTGLVPHKNNLKKLNLDINDRINSVRDFTSLTSLNISSNSSIQDCDLLTLTNLTLLNIISNTNISESIAQLTNLKRIGLGGGSNNAITDHHLSILTSLEMLKIYGRAKITGSCLFQLTNLTCLVIIDSFYGNAFSYEHISWLTNLTKLNIPLYGSNLSNEGVGKLTNLTNLSLGFHTSSLITFETIQSLKKLKRIFLLGAPILREKLKMEIPGLVLLGLK